MALLEVENLQAHFRTPEGVNRAVDGLSLTALGLAFTLGKLRLSSTGSFS